MRLVAGHGKSSGNMDTYSNKADRQEVVGEAKGRQGKGNRGEKEGKWRGGERGRED